MPFFIKKIKTKWLTVLVKIKKKQILRINKKKISPINLSSKNLKYFY